MSKKEYRVVCTKERFKDEIIVDIVPASGMIHEMIYASRKKQNPKLEDYAGSVFLTETEGQEPVVTFGNMTGLSKKSLLGRYYENLSKSLSPLILETYAAMKAAGKKATLEVSMQDYFAMYRGEGEAKNTKDEALKERAEKIKRIEQNKKDVLSKRALSDASHKPEIMMAWRQALYRGD